MSHRTDISPLATNSKYTEPNGFKRIYNSNYNIDHISASTFRKNQIPPQDLTNIGNVGYTIPNNSSTKPPTDYKPLRQKDIYSIRIRKLTSPDNQGIDKYTYNSNPGNDYPSHDTKSPISENISQNQTITPRSSTEILVDMCRAINKLDIGKLDIKKYILINNMMKMLFITDRIYVMSSDTLECMLEALENVIENITHHTQKTTSIDGVLKKRQDVHKKEQLEYDYMDMIKSWYDVMHSCVIDSDIKDKLIMALDQNI